MKLVFDEEALVDLEGIYNWIAKDNPAAAKAVVERVFESVEHLASFPHMGHAGRDAGTEEWVVPRLPYGLIAMRFTLHSEIWLVLRRLAFIHRESVGKHLRASMARRRAWPIEQLLNGRDLQLRCKELVKQPVYL